VTSQTSVILAELRKRLAELYGERLERLVLFGSHARGDAEEGSDIDVLIVLKGAVDLGGEVEFAGGLLAELSLKFDTVISPVFVSSSRYRTSQTPLLRNIRREGLPL